MFVSVCVCVHAYVCVCARARFYLFVCVCVVQVCTMYVYVRVCIKERRTHPATFLRFPGFRAAISVLGNAILTTSSTSHHIAPSRARVSGMSKYVHTIIRALFCAATRVGHAKCRLHPSCCRAATR